MDVIVQELTDGRPGGGDDGDVVVRHGGVGKKGGSCFRDTVQGPLADVTSTSMFMQWERFVDVLSALAAHSGCGVTS